MGTGGGREAIDDTDGRSSAMVATQRRRRRARRRSGCRAPLARPRRQTGRGPRQEHRVGVHAALGGVALVDAGASRPRSSVRVPSNSATRARTTATAFPSGRDCGVLRARRSRRPVQTTFPSWACFGEPVGGEDYSRAGHRPLRILRASGVGADPERGPYVPLTCSAVRPRAVRVGLRVTTGSLPSDRCAVDGVARGGCVATARTR